MPKSQRYVLGLCIAGSLSLSASFVFAQEPLPEGASDPMLEGTPPPATPTPQAPAEPGTTSTDVTVSDPTTSMEGAELDTVPTPELKLEEQRGTYVYGSATERRSERGYFPNRPLLATGITTLAVAYAPAAIVAAAGDHEGDSDLYYPVAGPWMYLAREDHDPGMKTLLVLDGIFQDLGALMTLMSFVVPETRRRSRYYGNENLHIMPRFARFTERNAGVAGYTVGLGASGRF